MPKKLSSWVVARAVWESVEPIIPNLKGLAPSFASRGQPLLQGFPGVLVGDHVRVLGRAEAAPVPGPVVGELVVGGQARVRLAVALDLGHLVDRLPPHPALGVVAVQGLTVGQGDGVEHEAVGEVAVVGDGQQAVARLLLVGRHPVPQVLGIGGVVVGEGQDPVGPGLVSPEDHVAVQVVPAGAGRPLEADEGGEDAGLVVLLGVRRDPLPDRPRQGVVALQGVVPLRHALAPQGVGPPGIAFLDEPVDLLAELRPQELGVGLGDHGGEAQVLGVVGHHQEVQGALQADAHPGAGHDGLAAGEAVGLLGSQGAADHPRVGGERRVEMGVPPEDALGVAPVQVGRVLLPAQLDVALFSGEVQLLGVRRTG